MTTRVSIAHGGEMTEQEMPSAGRMVSSNDYQSAGVKVSRGMGSVNVTDAADLSDTDIVQVDGMEITAKMARELGLMGRVFDESLSTGATAAAAEAHAAKAQSPDAAKSATGNADLDGVVDGLNEALEDGSIGLEEAQIYEAAFGEVALSGLSLEHAIETLEGIEDGTVDANAVPADVRANLSAVEGRITDAATKSAKAELGSETFNWLQSAATSNADVSNAIRQFAFERATGQAPGITWADFAEHVRTQLR